MTTGNGTVTDTLIALVPDYGLYVLFATIVLACLAAPLPASMLLMVSGAFAASGDLVWWHVACVGFAAYVVGDQIAYWVASIFGSRLLGKLRQKPQFEPVIVKSEDLLARRGRVAVILSHTVLSPTCPYVSYLCGAGGMAWVRFTPAAAIGAAVWSGFYLVLGYAFATQIEQIATMIGNFFGVVMAGCAGLAALAWLRKSWENHQREFGELGQAASPDP